MKSRSTMQRLCLALLALGLLAGSGERLTHSRAREPDKAHLMRSVSLRKMADSLRAVIAAQREVYAREFFQRAGPSRLDAVAFEGATNGPPVPARLLRLANRHVQQHGAEFSYVLRSPWAINPAEGPQTDIEAQALARIIQDPDTPLYYEEELGGRSYFTAVYADRATLPACVQCHNRHPKSPRRDFKPGDVMGALVVRIPLEF